MILYLIIYSKIGYTITKNTPKSKCPRRSKTGTFAHLKIPVRSEQKNTTCEKHLSNFLTYLSSIADAFTLVQMQELNKLC